MPTAAIYCRISDDRAGRGLGVKRQEDQCRALCSARGWDVGEVFVDNDTSAYSGKPRPAYERLLGAVSDRRVDAVVAWHGDRLHRSPRELERFIDVIEGAKAKVATVQGGEYDLSTASGRMTARVVGAVARHESEHKSERHRAKAAELAKAGKVGGGGTRPFGYLDDRRTVHKGEAKIVREMVARVLAGEALRGLAADLNARGISSVTGAQWAPFTLSRLLQSPRIAGLRSHRGTVVGEAEWPAIITRADHERVAAILSDPARRTNRTARSYLLTGLAYCGVCGARLVARPRDDKRRRYVCAKGPGFSGCGAVMVLADGPEGIDFAVAHPELPLVGVDTPARRAPGRLDIGLEEFVVEQLLQRLDSPNLAATIRDGAPVGEVEDLSAIEARLDELATAWADGEIDRRSWLAARKRLEERQAEARRAIVVPMGAEALSPFAGRVGALRKAWQGLSFDQRRAIVVAAVDRVVVGAGVKGRNYFDPGRVEVFWRA